MIKNYRLSTDNSLSEYAELENFTYIIKPSKEEIGTVASHFDFPYDYLSCILDDYENARYEKDKNNNYLVLLQYPAISDEGKLVTFPYALIWTNSGAVVLGLNHEVALPALFERPYNEKRYEHQILFRIMSQMTLSFNEKLTDFRHQRQSLEKSIKNSTKNDQIVEMISMQTSLIYFETALANNLIVMNELIKQLRSSKEDGFADRIYDVYVEAEQAYNETKIQLKLLENLRDLFSNIVSNNLNIVMKIMTSATFVLGIPAIIFGFYGVNVPIPGQKGQAMVWLIIGITLLICGWVSWILHKHDMM
jgi:magnesium transporter